MEVFNLFSGVVRQEGLSRMEKARQRQSLVPDLRIDVPPLGIAEVEAPRAAKPDTNLAQTSEQWTSEQTSSSRSTW